MYDDDRYSDDGSGAAIGLIIALAILAVVLFFTNIILLEAILVGIGIMALLIMMGTPVILSIIVGGIAGFLLWYGSFKEKVFNVVRVVCSLCWAVAAGGFAAYECMDYDYSMPVTLLCSALTAILTFGITFLLHNVSRGVREENLKTA